MRSLHFGHVPTEDHSFYRARPRSPRIIASARTGPELGAGESVIDCQFCRIVARQSPAEIEYEDEIVLAFKDIYPKTPVHILIVPKRHIPSILELAPEDAETIGRCFVAARAIGAAKGFGERGYRVSVNCGPDGGQLVYHVHFHFTAGRRREG